MCYQKQIFWYNNQCRKFTDSFSFVALFSRRSSHQLSVPLYRATQTITCCFTPREKNKNDLSWYNFLQHLIFSLFFFHITSHQHSIFSYVLPAFCRGIFAESAFSKKKKTATADNSPMTLNLQINQKHSRKKVKGSEAYQMLICTNLFSFFTLRSAVSLYKKKNISI